LIDHANICSYTLCVWEIDQLEAAARAFDREADDDFVDAKRLAGVIDLLQVKLSKVLESGRRRGDYQLARLSPASWAARTCGMSRAAAADRLCVGRQLPFLPEVAKALDAGEIGYQSASAICHLREQLGDRWDPSNEGETVDYARRFSVEHFRLLCRHARHAADPDAFDKDAEDDYERRWLKISPLLDGMHAVDGVLDPVTGAAFRTALDSLAHWRGPEDSRNQGQRMADALGELLNHAMDKGVLPRKQGVRPHITVTTTLETFKDEIGAAAAELGPGIPISSQTVQRLACDGTLSRVLKANSVVVDVGRATRSVSPAQWRALKARCQTCCWPGCDRPITWTNPHHIDFWCDGGPNDLDNLLPLCHFHHRLVHEGGWQVVRVGGAIRFIPPDRYVPRRARGPGLRRAA
jgi:hypothetical protein